MKVFQRFHALGDDKFTKIRNALLRGEPSTAMARAIQSPPPDGWGDFQGVPELTLITHLNRLRTALAEGSYTPRIAKMLSEGKSIVHQRIFTRLSVRVLDRMEELADVQRERVFNLVKKENEAILPHVPGRIATSEYRHLLTQTNMVFVDYRQTLLDLQDVRFKLGLDEYKGPVGASVKGISQTTTFPDGMSVQKQVFEAVQTVEQILDARRIPYPPRE